MVASKPEFTPMKILVAEPLAAAGIELLKAQPGWDVVISNPKEYAQHLADAEALFVRSAVKVNAEVLAKAPKLKVIGRAGVGVDNVDLPAATAAGVLVMNTPGGNAVAVAEHTLGLMLCMARSIPQASASTKSGKWEKKKFMGAELRGKTLGILGLGYIGQEVVKRARGFEMKIIACDPYANPKIAADLGVPLVSLDELYAQADYITLHVAITKETNKMLNDAAFAKMKTGVRIVNCARGELVDERGAGTRDSIRQGSGSFDRRVRDRAASSRRSTLRAGDGIGDAAHRRLHRRSAGDRGRAHRRAGGGVSATRCRRQCGERCGRREIGLKWDTLCRPAADSVQSGRFRNAMYNWSKRN